MLGRLVLFVAVVHAAEIALIIQVESPALLQHARQDIERAANYITRYYAGYEVHAYAFNGEIPNPITLVAPGGEIMEYYEEALRLDHREHQNPIRWEPVFAKALERAPEAIFFLVTHAAIDVVETRALYGDSVLVFPAGIGSHIEDETLRYMAAPCHWCIKGFNYLHSDARAPMRANSREQGSGICMQDLFGGPGLSCSANDVGLGFVTLLGNNQTCIIGENVTIPIGAYLQPNAVQRYDIAITLAKDGGTGITGDCHNFNLSPVSVDNMDIDVSSGVGPYFNGELGTADVCGDIRNADGLNFVNLGNQTILCADFDGNGEADLNGGVAWDNNVSTGKGMSPHCLGPDDARPGTASKCRFNLININGLRAINGTLPTGACCLPFDYTFSPFGNVTCVNVLSDEACISIGGYFNGLNSTCAETECTCTPEERTLDFTTDWRGVPIQPGDLLNNVYDGWNVHLSVLSGNGFFRAFNSSDPSCDDFDLGSPNQDFGGPGVGSGGASGQPGENPIAHNMVGIVNNETSSCQPDYLREGSIIQMMFPLASTIHWIGILDSEGTHGIQIDMYLDMEMNLMMHNYTTEAFGDNSFQNFTVNTECVRAMKIYATSPIAVTSIGITRTCPGYCPLQPTPSPTVAPTPSPTEAPTDAPTAGPTLAPTLTPTPGPTEAPTLAPTPSPTEAPTDAPTAGPTLAPTLAPTEAPTLAPTPSPTSNVTLAPTPGPTEVPTDAPTPSPTSNVTLAPTLAPTPSPTSNVTLAPTLAPTPSPTSNVTTPTPAPSDTRGLIVGSSLIGLAVLICLLGFCCIPVARYVYHYHYRVRVQVSQPSDTTKRIRIRKERIRHGGVVYM